MGLQFEPGFLKETSRAWGIKPAEAEAVVGDADHVHERFLGPSHMPKAIRLRLYLKHVEQGRSCQTLVMTDRRGDVERIEDAWPIPYSIFPRTKDPLELLRQVVNRFGYPLKVGDADPRKLYLTEAVPAPPPDEPQFEIIAPGGRHGMLSQSVVQDAGVLYVVYAFALDVAAFSAALTGRVT